MMSCLLWRRRRREKALRVRGEEHKVAFAEEEHFLKSSKNRRSPQWRPILSTISEGRTAISGGSSLQTAPGSTVKKELVTKPSRRVPLETPSLSRYWNLQNTAMPDFGGEFFLF